MIPGISMGAWLGADQEPNLYTILETMGLTDGLLFCLDAGSERSYNGGQVWKDLSPNGADFYLGGGSGAEGSDPTFNGTFGGLSEAEFFAYDGGDYFQEVAAGWGDDDLHKADVGFSAIAITHQPTTASVNCLFSTHSSANSSRNPGVRWQVNTSVSSLSLITGNGSTSDIESSGLSDQVGMNFYGCRFVWAANRNISAEFTVNTAQDTKSFTPSTGPSSSGPTSAGQIGAVGGGTFSASGTRIYCNALWRGRVISQAQMLAIRAKLKELRFPSLVF